MSSAASDRKERTERLLETATETLRVATAELRAVNETLQRYLGLEAAPRPDLHLVDDETKCSKPS